MNRIIAIVRADFWIRFRRTSTAVLFLFLCIAAYLWVPSPSTGKALMQINGHRTIYDSAAVSSATAALCSMLLLLFGYYMVSSSIRRDIQTRSGFIIASTTVRDIEYLVGKFLGNVVFLTAIACGYMISSMVMQIVRGEAPLEPFVFIQHYGFLVLPAIFFVSIAALTFESVRFLSGRFGDFVYFILWFMLLALGAFVENNKAEWPAYFDTSGLITMIMQITQVTGNNTASIGSTTFDAAATPITFPGMSFSWIWILRRIVSATFAIPLLFLALLFFHRFDPAKLKASAHRARQNLLTRLNSGVKKLSIHLVPNFTLPVPRNGFAGALISETALTFRIFPIALLALLGFGIAVMVCPATTVQHGLLPAVFAGLVLILSELSSRETRANTLRFIFSAPHLKQRFVLWKFATALMVTFSFTLLPLIRLPQYAPAIMTGSIFIAATATTLGYVSGNPKTFIVTFLMFLYVVMNDGGKRPDFDFAGWYGIATPAVMVWYLGLSAAMLLAAQAVHSFRLRRTW